MAAGEPGGGGEDGDEAGALLAREVEDDVEETCQQHDRRTRTEEGELPWLLRSVEPGEKVRISDGVWAKAFGEMFEIMGEGKEEARLPDINQENVVSGIKNLRSLDRVWELGLFFALNICLLFWDIGSDLYNGIDLLRQGHTYWGTWTIALQFFPLLGYCTTFAFFCFKKWRMDAKQPPAQAKRDRDRSLLEALQHLPGAQPLVNCYYFLKLLAMDTDKASNNKLKEEVKANAAGLSFYEAFLEAGPQFILQLSIIIRVGYYTPSQLMALPFSWFSLIYAATKTHYLQRLSEFADPDPPLAKNVFLHIVIFFPVATTFIVTWSFLFAYMKLVALVMVAGSLLINTLLIRMFRIKRDVINIAESEEDKAAADVELSDLRNKAIFTSVLTPCIAGHHDTNLLMLSGVSMTMCLSMWLQFILPHTALAPLTMRDNPPISHCFVDNDTSLVSQVCLYDGQSVTECGQKYIRECGGPDCLPSVRICNVGEQPMDVLTDIVTPILLACLLASLLICCLLQWMSDFYNVLLCTSTLTRERKAFIHRSLLCTLVQRGDHQKLNDVLSRARKAGSKELEEVVSRANAAGDTPLHIACRDGKEYCALLLLSHSAKPLEPNAAGKTPVHLAARGGHLKCLQMLLQKREKSKEQTKQRGKDVGDGIPMAIVNPVEGNVEVLSENEANLSPERLDSALKTADLLLTTALEYAVRKHRFHCVAYLLQAGGRLRGKDVRVKEEPWSLLQAAIDSGCGEAVAAFVRAAHEEQTSSDKGEGEGVFTDMLLRDIDGVSPLWYAAAREEEDLALLYLLMAYYKWYGPPCKSTFFSHKDRESYLIVDYLNSKKPKDFFHLCQRDQVVGTITYGGVSFSHVANHNTEKLLQKLYLHLLTRADKVSYLRQSLDEKYAAKERECGSLLKYGVMTGSPETLKGLLERHVPSSAEVGSLGKFPALHLALQRGDGAEKETVATILSHLSALQYPEGEGHYKAVANFKMQGQTPLHYVIMEMPDRLDLIEVLIGHGGSIEERADYGTKETFSTLHLAAQKGEWSVVDFLLRQGASPEERSGGSGGWLPLHTAAAFGKVSAAERLLQDRRGKELIDSRTKNTNETSLHLAARRWKPEAVGALLLAGADPDPPGGGSSPHGDSPLCVAARGGSLEVAKMLVDAGARLDWTNSAGESAAFLAAKNKSRDVEDFLRQSGALFLPSAEVAAKKNESREVTARSPKIAARIPFRRKEKGKKELMHGYAFSQEEGGVVSQFELIRSYSAVDVHTKRLPGAGRDTRSDDDAEEEKEEEDSGIQNEGNEGKSGKTRDEEMVAVHIGDNVQYPEVEEV